MIGAHAFDSETQTRAKVALDTLDDIDALVEIIINNGEEAERSLGGELSDTGYNLV